MAKKIAAAVVVLVLLGVILVFAPVFTVREVTVRGTTTLSEQVVVDAAGVPVGDNLLRLDAAGIAQRVVQIPRVREATVKRRLPSTVAIDVVERKVVAWIDTGSTVLVDDRGETFADPIDAGPPPDAMRIEGVAPDDAELLSKAVEVIAALAEQDVAQHIDHLSIHGPAEFVLHVRNGSTFIWGAPEDNRNKALAAQTLLGQESGQWNISDPTMVTRR
ncbi:cell division protein FtsQ/DivIB [Corynebacterium uterequi]|uniref:Cell division septal protein n=1 Tax=Corynebacterium uterequi TaxID=1072256 RepID=A0A0G3HDK7_9CORY|nr:FtsQ-type POTRA domain-containing protein [Corynebacterium uterequi]AKK11456.1 cell division septal protein [Corynebacterium uterequi]